MSWIYIKKNCHENPWNSLESFFFFQIKLKYPIEINVTDIIFNYSIVQFKVEAFPLIKLFQKTNLQLC